MIKHLLVITNYKLSLLSAIHISGRERNKKIQSISLTTDKLLSSSVVKLFYHIIKH